MLSLILNQISSPHSQNLIYPQLNGIGFLALGLGITLIVGFLFVTMAYKILLWALTSITN